MLQNGEKCHRKNQLTMCNVLSYLILSEVYIHIYKTKVQLLTFGCKSAQFIVVEQII